MSPTPNLSRIGGCYPTISQRVPAGGTTSPAGGQDVDGRPGAPDAGAAE
jgi:hypothetical protein